MHRSNKSGMSLGFPFDTAENREEFSSSSAQFDSMAENKHRATLYEAGALANVDEEVTI